MYVLKLAISSCESISKAATTPKAANKKQLQNRNSTNQPSKFSTAPNSQANHKITSDDNIPRTTPPKILPTTKETEEKRKVRLEYKKFLLENRKESYGAVALLEKQLDLERVNKQLDEVNAFIAAITAHKATL